MHAPRAIGVRASLLAAMRVVAEKCAVMHVGPITGQIAEVCSGWTPYYYAQYAGEPTSSADVTAILDAQTDAAHWARPLLVSILAAHGKWAAIDRETSAP